MKKIMMIATAVVITASLAGCSTEASRMAECRNQGVSRDACYQAEQTRQAAIIGASQKQAYENAASLYSDNDSDGQNHHKHHHHDD